MANIHRISPEQHKQREAVLTEARENVRVAFNVYLDVLRAALDVTPRGSGHAANEFDHLQACITQTNSAKRVMWMDN